MARRIHVSFQFLLGQEGVDQLEALPGPVAQLVSVVDIGHAEDVACLDESEPETADLDPNRRDRARLFLLPSWAVWIDPLRLRFSTPAPGLEATIPRWNQSNRN
jgi:hypothetical protein